MSIDSNEKVTAPSGDQRGDWTLQLSENIYGNVHHTEGTDGV